MYTSAQIKPEPATGKRPAVLACFCSTGNPTLCAFPPPEVSCSWYCNEYFRAVRPAKGRGKEPPVLCPPAPGCRGWGAGDPSPGTLSQRAIDLGPPPVSRGAQPMMKWSIWAEPCWFTYLLRHLWLLEIPFKIQCSRSAPCTVDSGQMLLMNSRGKEAVESRLSCPWEASRECREGPADHAF